MTKVEPLSLRRRLALELWRKSTAILAEEHPLRQLFWECTLRCNLNCRHCGSDCKVKTEARDMPLADFLGVLDNVKEHTDPHRVFVIITGGEPLMREDIAECGAAIYEKGFPWGMVTNALALTPEKFDSLLRAGLHTMAVSMDGLGDEHNWMRGNAHSFERVSQAIDLLVAHPEIKFDIVTCVNHRNYPHLELIKRFLIDKGVKRWRLLSVFPVGRAAADQDMHLLPEQYRGILEFIKQTRREGAIHCSYGCEGFMGNYEGDIRDNLFRCHAGLVVGSVLVDGSISACASIRSNYHQGNIYCDKFMDVWNTRYEAYRNREWMRSRGECADCKYFRYCLGNGMHLRDDGGNLIMCPLHRLK